MAATIRYGLGLVLGIVMMGLGAYIALRPLLGAPPVTGSLQGVVLELYPAVKTQVAEDRTAALGRRRSRRPRSAGRR